MLGPALFEGCDDFGWSGITGGNVYSHALAARFQGRKFGVVICTVHMRAFFLRLGATRRPRERTEGRRACWMTGSRCQDVRLDGLSLVPPYLKFGRLFLG